MRRTEIVRVGIAVVILELAVAGLNVNAQSVDSLLDKLVEKGILTVKEANALREEADKDFTKAYQVKSGLPDWVTSLKLSGDLRARYEGFYGENPACVDRHRFRYRARVGVTASLVENFEAGVRLSSSERADNFGGDPISGNATLMDNASKKFIFIDLAYAKWTAINSASVGLVGTVGKMENPFVFSDMVFDPDYTPEGGAVQLSYTVSDAHVLRLNTGWFALDELGASSHDPYMVGAQARWDANWSRKVSTTAGIAFLAIANRHALSNAALPNINRGNTRVGAASAVAAPRYGLNPVVADAALTYALDSFPYYNGPFPMRVAADYMVNPAAPRSADNYAYTLSATLGRAGRKRTWELGYSWKWLGANAWWEELVDSDFGAYYAGANSPPNSGFNAGYGAGTNAKGHIIRAAYSPTDHLTLAARVFLTELIEPFPPGSESGMTRLQVDALLRF
ncbi:MAG: putative porin [Verrucomicrobiae bacterium]|nr:putative porin [Verrucomicrobiae bacterium]MDW7979431.1 putative porin [Verrucomicrobiales bacterium]